MLESWEPTAGAGNVGHRPGAHPHPRPGDKSGAGTHLCPPLPPSLQCPGGWRTPGELGQRLRGLLHAERVLVEHVDGRDEEAGPGDVVRVVVAVRDGREQLVVLPRDGAAHWNPRVIHVLLQRVNIHLDLVLGVEAAAVDVEARVHPAAEVAALGDGAVGRQPDHRHVADAALLDAPVARGLDGVRPELKHACGDEAQQDDGEEGDVVDAVFGLHSRDEGRTPDVVLDRRTHNDTDSLALTRLVTRGQERRMKLGGCQGALERAVRLEIRLFPSLRWLDEIRQRHF